MRKMSCWEVKDVHCHLKDAVSCLSVWLYRLDRYHRVFAFLLSAVNIGTHKFARSWVFNPNSASLQSKSWVHSNAKAALTGLWFMLTYGTEGGERVWWSRAGEGLWNVRGFLQKKLHLPLVASLDPGSHPGTIWGRGPDEFCSGGVMWHSGAIVCHVSVWKWRCNESEIGILSSLVSLWTIEASCNVPHKNYHVSSFLLLFSPDILVNSRQKADMFCTVFDS